jgi:hypothetical protein
MGRRRQGVREEMRQRLAAGLNARRGQSPILLKMILRIRSSPKNQPASNPNAD